MRCRGIDGDTEIHIRGLTQGQDRNTQVDCAVVRFEERTKRGSLDRRKAAYHRTSHADSVPVRSTPVDNTLAWSAYRMTEDNRETGI